MYLVAQALAYLGGLAFLSFAAALLKWGLTDDDQPEAEPCD